MMNLPLTKIIESISNNLSEAERMAFYAVINTVAEGKDLSNTHWAFLGSELRALSVELPKRLRLPKYIQAIIDSVIAGMDRLADGKEWPEVAKAIEAAGAAYAKVKDSRTGYAKPKVCIAMSAIEATTAAAAAARAAAAADVDKAAADAGFATTFAANSASLASTDSDFGVGYTKGRIRQRDRLLEIIENAKPIKGKIMANKRGHHRKTEQARNAARIREIIKNNPYAKPKDIIEATGLHPSTVSRHLKALREQSKKGEEAGK